MNWNEYSEKLKSLDKIPDEWFILGIDLGTTNSVISYWNYNSKKPQPIDASDGFGQIPMASVVQCRENDDNEEWIVGNEAFRSQSIYSESTFRSIKRKMGLDEKVKLGKNYYSPEELTSKILLTLVENIKKITPKAEVIGIVVTIPYDFDDAARKATIKALELAGLKDKLICLMEEPKAASLAYSCNNEIVQDEKILIFDFGGGTLDITLFHVSEKNENSVKMQVISEGGQAYHGGDNIDKIILNKCYEFVKEKTGLEVFELSKENLAELEMRAIETKERLSGVKSYRIPFTFSIPPFIKELKREDLEKLCEKFIDQTKKLVTKSLNESTLGPLLPDEIDKIIIEGGSSKMPWVKNLLIQIFNDEKKIYISEKPALDISAGATIYAAMKMGILDSFDIETKHPSIKFDVNIPHDIGFEVSKNGKNSFHTMIKRGTSYTLAKKSQIFVLKGEDEEEMTKFNLKIMERINKNDKVEMCKPIGEVTFIGLPKRPKGKTKLKITIKATEEGGIISGSVEDLGFKDEFSPSNYKMEFEPNAFTKTILEG